MKSLLQCSDETMHGLAKTFRPQFYLSKTSICYSPRTKTCWDINISEQYSCDNSLSASMPCIDKNVICSVRFSQCLFCEYTVYAVTRYGSHTVV